jgi:hypothetical protein
VAARGAQNDAPQRGHSTRSSSRCSSSRRRVWTRPRQPPVTHGQLMDMPLQRPLRAQVLRLQRSPSGRTAMRPKVCGFPPASSWSVSTSSLRLGASRALRLAPELKIRDRVEKLLLRHAFPDVLPDYIAACHKNPMTHSVGLTNASGCSGRCSRGCTAPSSTTSPRPTREPRRGRPVHPIPDAAPARVVPVAVGRSHAPPPDRRRQRPPDQDRPGLSSRR